jgi:methionyl aminopeptidase
MTENNEIIKSLEIAGNIHKQVSKKIKEIIKPNIKLLDIAKFAENQITELTKTLTTINKGIAFPIGLSINSCAAHYHPHLTDNTILLEDDIMKIDFGVEVNEWIIDSSFTEYFDHKYDIVNNAVKEATNVGIKNASIDVDINDWSTEIKEILESYNIHPIKNLGGHNIEKGNVHGEYFLPACPNPNLIHKRFDEGVYAIEIFGSTEDDITFENGEPTIYKINQYTTPNLKLMSSKKIYNKLKNEFRTLPFSIRFINNLPNINTQLNVLIKNNLLQKYPPLCVKNGYVAQYEHTIFINETKKINFSQDEE